MSIHNYNIYKMTKNGYVLFDTSCDTLQKCIELIQLFPRFEFKIENKSLIITE